MLKITKLGLNLTNFVNVMQRKLWTLFFRTPCIFLRETLDPIAKSHVAKAQHIGL